MGDRTGIEWTDATWNPVTGCTKVSAGCDNCYAETVANRLQRENYTKRLPVVDTPENRADPFAVRTWPDRLDQPLRWKRTRAIFVNSMSDMFHKDLPVGFLDRAFDVMLDANWHTYQVLTKRPHRASAYVRNRLSRGLWDCPDLPHHIWIGTSVEDQSVVYRIRHLRAVPASIRFLSIEPLIGPLSLTPAVLEGIHWVIVGGESGKNHRPIDPDWVRSIRDVCVSAGVPFFFKQWGGLTPKSGGRELDGRTWEEMPDLGDEVRRRKEGE